MSREAGQLVSANLCEELPCVAEQGAREKINIAAETATIEVSGYDPVHIPYGDHVESSEEAPAMLILPVFMPAVARGGESGSNRFAQAPGSWYPITSEQVSSSVYRWPSWSECSSSTGRAFSFRPHAPGCALWQWWSALRCYKTGVPDKLAPTVL